jgi:ribose transport system substrate-binding protein
VEERGLEDVVRRSTHFIGARPLRLRAVAVASVVVAAVALGACGSGDSDSGAGSGGGGAETNTAASQRLLRQYQQQPEFVPPGPPFDARRALAGKKIMSIPVSSQIPITQVLERTMAATAKRIGFQFKHWQNQGKPDQWVQGINTAINQRYDAIDLLAIDPSKLKPQIDKARRAGVKVISTHFAGFGWEPPNYIDGAVRLPYYEVGRILAAWAVDQTQGKANALAVVANDLVSTADVVKGLRDEFSRNCPECKLQVANVPTVEWATGVQNEVQSGIQRNPKLNFLIPIYDAMTQFALAGVRAANRAGQIKIDTFNGTPFALDLVRKGEIQMNLGENEVWIAMAMLDASMRAAAGMKVPTDTYRKAPLYIFTRENVAQAGTPPDPAKGYGSDYKSGFDKLWGIGQS